MNNKSVQVGNWVAQEMQTIVNSPQHQAIYSPPKSVTIKTASESTKCCHCDKCDSACPCHGKCGKGCEVCTSEIAGTKKSAQVQEVLSTLNKLSAVLDNMGLVRSSVSTISALKSVLTEINKAAAPMSPEEREEFRLEKLRHLEQQISKEELAEEQERYEDKDYSVQELEDMLDADSSEEFDQLHEEDNNEISDKLVRAIRDIDPSISGRNRTLKNMLSISPLGDPDLTGEEDTEPPSSYDILEPSEGESYDPEMTMFNLNDSLPRPSKVHDITDRDMEYYGDEADHRLSFDRELDATLPPPAEEIHEMHEVMAQLDSWIEKYAEDEEDELEDDDEDFEDEE